MNVIHSTNFMTVILYSDYIRTLTFENICSKKKIVLHFTTYHSRSYST
jgi:hypothetical protein